MKRMILAAATLFCGVAILLTGCGKPPVIDATSTEAYEASYKKMTKGMSPAKKAQLDEAIAKFVETKSKRYLRMCGNNATEATRLAYVELDEMSADEIIGAANSKNQ